MVQFGNAMETYQEASGHQELDENCSQDDPHTEVDDTENMTPYTLIFYPTTVLVTTLFWARVLCSLAAEDACFRMRITLGVVLIRSLVFHVCVPECSRNGSGMRPYLLVREKIV